MVTIIAPAMGIAVRFTRSKEETPPIPEDTTITAVIGEQLRMIEAAKCIGQQHQYRVQAAVRCNCRSKCSECEEGSIAAAHNNCGYSDDCYHNQHHSHRPKPKFYCRR